MSSKYFNNKRTNDDLEVKDVKDVKPLIKSEVKTEIPESPEMVVKRYQLKRESESEDMAINLPKSRNKKRFLSDTDEEEDQTKKQMKSLDPMNDSSAKIAFEEMCENTIKELQDLFPEIDICEIQDALIESNWSVFNASIKLGNICENNAQEVDANGVKEELKICTNNEKMKSLDFYRLNLKKDKNGGSSDEESVPTSSHTFNSIKNNKNKFLKRNKPNDTEIIELSEDDSDGGGDYNRNDERIVCGSSDESDSDGDSQGFKEKGSNKMYFRTQELKEKVVNFLEHSNPFELQIVPGISQKKIESLINLRPFLNWNDCMIKFSSSGLSTDILDNCAEVLKARQSVQRLMDLCEEISNELTETVEKLKPLAQPKILTSDLKLSNYQLIGLNWLVLMYKKGINCILADEMGLGKTIQVIAFFAHLRERTAAPVKGPHLVIVPASTLDNWSREFEVWCPSIKVLMYYGSQEERATIREQIQKDYIDFDVIITTYTVAQSPGDKSLFKRNKFRCVVFDEAHFLKNMRSQRYAALMNLNAKYRLLLTGTPLQNNLVELMSLLIFTMPHLFKGKTDQIKTLFSYTNKESVHRIKYINDRIAQAKKIMRPFVLRRLKSEVLQELPIKLDINREVRMCDEQELKYMGLIEKYTREIKYKKITFEDSEPEEKYQRGTGMLMDLRKMANHPLLLRNHYDDNKLRQMTEHINKEEVYRSSDPKYIFEDMQVMNDFELHRLCKKFDTIYKFKLNEELILESGKFKELDILLNSALIEGKRVLLFSQFVIMLDIIEEYMNLRDYKYLRLDGMTKVGDRIDLIDKFNNDPELFVFLLSTRAGGLGINLTAASVVIIHDIDFNPYNDKQAEDRCHRIGQTKEVIVYRFISQNTIEEGMLKIAEEKLKLGQEISAPNQGKEEEQQMEKSDVKTLLRTALKL